MFHRKLLTTLSDINDLDSIDHLWGMSDGLRDLVGRGAPGRSGGSMGFERWNLGAPHVVHPK